MEESEGVGMDKRNTNRMHRAMDHKHFKLWKHRGQKKKRYSNHNLMEHLEVRNAKIFKNINFSTNEVLFRARSMSTEWEIRNKLSPDTNERRQITIIRKDHQVRWNPPDIGNIKVNFDGSVKEGQGTAGYVIRNYAGHLLATGATKVGETTVPMVEALAMRSEVKKALEMGCRKIEVGGDNKIAIQSIRGEIESPWRINIIKNAREFQKYCIRVKINHVFREGNRTADWIASAGHRYIEDFEWSASPSHELDIILQADKLGMTLDRRAS